MPLLSSRARRAAALTGVLLGLAPTSVALAAHDDNVVEPWYPNPSTLTVSYSTATGRLVQGTAGIDTVDVYDGTLRDEMADAPPACSSCAESDVRFSVDTGGGADSIEMAGDVRHVAAGDGDDHVIVWQSSTPPTIELGAGTDYVHIGSGRATIDCGAGDDTVVYSAGQPAPAMTGCERVRTRGEGFIRGYYEILSAMRTNGGEWLHATASAGFRMRTSSSPRTTCAFDTDESYAPCSGDTTQSSRGEGRHRMLARLIDTDGTPMGFFIGRFNWITDLTAPPAPQISREYPTEMEVPADQEFVRASGEIARPADEPSAILFCSLSGGSRDFEWPRQPCHWDQVIAVTPGTSTLTLQIEDGAGNRGPVVTRTIVGRRPGEPSSPSPAPAASPPPATAPPATAPGAVARRPAAAFTAADLPAHLRFRSGRASVACPTASCRITVTRRGTLLASGRGARSVRVTLSGAGRRALRAGRALRATLTVTPRGAAKVNRTVTLRR